MSLEAQNALDEPNTYNERGAARYIGTSVSSLRRRRKSRRAPAWIQIDRSIRYRKYVLDKFLDDHTVEPEESVTDPDSPHNAPGAESKRVQ